MERDAGVLVSVCLVAALLWLTVDIHAAVEVRGASEDSRPHTGGRE